MQYLIDLTNIHGVLFDMDGTMVDNQPYHKKAWQEYYQQFGKTLTDEDYRTKFSGKKNRELFPMMFDKAMTDEEIKQHAEAKVTLYRKLYDGHVTPIPGLIELIQVLKQKGIKVAVATTAPEKNREFILHALRLTNAFDYIIGDEHVTKGKPDPEIFLKAAKALRVKPEECLVFEDSPSGIEAAKRAGMQAIGLLTSHTKEELGKADEVIKNFEEMHF